MNKKKPILMIGLDAAEVSLIEDLCSRKELPTLQSLKERGCFGIVEGKARVFAGGVWPTFYTSKEVPWHGFYHGKLWRHDKVRCEVASDGYLKERPFWEILDKNSFRTTVINVPMTTGASKLFNGVHISGWELMTL